MIWYNKHMVLYRTDFESCCLIDQKFWQTRLTTIIQFAFRYTVLKLVNNNNLQVCLPMLQTYQLSMGMSCPGCACQHVLTV